MNAVNGITNQGAQVFALSLEDGSRVTLSIYFRPQQNGWYFDVEWAGSAAAATPYTERGRRLVTSANMLRQARDLIPFGLACFTPDNADPSGQDVFADGSAVLVLLNAADVQQVEDEVFASSL